MAEEYLKHSGVEFAFFGGYEEAERKKCYFFPEFMGEIQDVSQVCEYGYSFDIDALLIKGSGFGHISHRAVMGSILGLGVERDVVGDIVLQNENEAVFFCNSQLTDFFVDNLERVGHDKIKVRKISLSELDLPKRRFLQINDTVASARLDCIVSALCSLSRERAKEKIESSFVELNFAIEERPDREIIAPATVSVRGVGKFRVLSVSDKTKKGRYRLLAEKYL